MGNCLGVIYMFDLKNKKNKKPYTIIHESSYMSQDKIIVKKDTMLNDNINIKEDHLSEPHHT